MINWLLVTKKISDLKKHPRNPRVLNKDQARHLKKSIEQFGMADKPIVNQDGTIIGGHQRLRILEDMGYEEIECWVPEIPLHDSEVDELCIRLNKNTGEFDFDVLANEWNEDDLCDWGFNDYDFGKIDDIEEDEKKEEKAKKLKMCVMCGYES